MTILAFYPVDGEFQRHSFDAMTDEEAFEMLLESKDDIRFYDTESDDGCDYYGLSQWIPNANILEDDYNNEDLDGGWWMKYLLIPSDKVREMIFKAFGIE